MTGCAKKIILLVFSSLLVSCSGVAKKKTGAPLMFQVTPVQFLSPDDADFNTLNSVLNRHIDYWKQRPFKVIRFGDSHFVSGEDYLRALQKAYWVLKKEGKAGMLSYLQDHFVFLSVKGEAPGSAFFTSYFEPLLEARHKRDDQFWQPIYELPKDMVVIDMGEWAKSFPQWSVWEDRSTEKKSRTAVLRGRLASATGNQPPRVTPYWSREEIDVQGKMRNKAQVLGYLDPVDSFFLQIQGSGALKFKNGQVVRVGYAAQNGHPYTAIGKFMFPVIPRSEMSLQTIEEYLRRLSANERQEFLSRNSSYVFFRKLKGRGETYMGTEVVDGRTIATDTAYYPKGTLAWISIPGVANLKSGQPVSRLVIDQDTGGAIRGPGRVDLFWGQGENAKKAAGDVKHEGKLFYLFPKSSL